MARIAEQNVVFTFSKLVKDHDDDQQLVDEEVLLSIEQVAQELVGTTVLVEAKVVQK